MVKTAMLGAVALVIALGGTCGVADALPLGQTDDPMIVAHRAGTRDLNRPGMSGDSSSWKGWGHVRWFIEEVPAGAA
ncbi:hypothetical protein K872_05978 [Mycobacterium tuberculosis TKK-01-0048]|nr:hypothetical protein K872_05978 [Mycobacterium tuberculosis TKK-01-0048]